MSNQAISHMENLIFHAAHAAFAAGESRVAEFNLMIKGALDAQGDMEYVGKIIEERDRYHSMANILYFEIMAIRRDDRLKDLLDQLAPSPTEFRDE